MNMVPEKCPHSYPWSLTWCLFMWPKGFCRADLIRNLEMGRFFWLPRWAQRNHKDPYERDAWRVRVRQGDRTAEVQHRTVRSLVTRSSCRSCIGKERDSPEGIQPHWLSWYFWPREWWDNEFVGLEALVWSHLSQQELESSTPKRWQSQPRPGNSDPGSSVVWTSSTQLVCAKTVLQGCPCHERNWGLIDAW